MSILDRDRNLLWGHSGNLCAMCRKSLVEERTPLDREAILGEQAHIAGKEPGSARHGECPPDVVDRYENLILLCGDDHTKIDKQPNTYTREVILRIKRDHEHWVKHTLKPSRFQAGNLSVAVPDSLSGQRLHGRDDLLAELVSLLDTTGGLVVLCGTGGCGKSALARAAAGHVRDHRTVWWVDGSTRATLLAGLFEVTVQAGANRVEAREVWRGGESAKDLLWRALESHARPWLLIVDNADDPSHLEGWVREPGSGNTVLVTSRDHRAVMWAPTAVLRHVLPISTADGAAVLTDLAPAAGSENDAAVLSSRLGGLPLALVLVGRYLARTSTGPVLSESRHVRTFTGYTSALDTEFADTIFALGRRVPHDQVLARTWERSLDLLESQGVAAARPLLRLLSFFSPSPLPAAILSASVMKFAPSLFGDIDADELEDAVAGLIAFGLLDHQHTEVHRTRTDTLDLHPLIGQISRIQPDVAEHLPVYRTLRVALLYKTAIDHDARDHTTWPTWQLLLPHCTFTTEDIEYTAEDEYLMQADLAYRVADYARAAGLWATAEEHYELSLGFRLERAPATHEDVLVTRHNRALLMQDQGRYTEAESELRHIAELTTETLGRDHPNTLAARHELARLFRSCGDLEAAEREFASIVPTMTDVLGAEHEHTLAARHERARTRRDLGDHAFAEREFILLVAATEVIGATSSLALNVRHELAGLLLRRGQQTQAQAMLRDLLGIEAEVLGVDHPSTLVTRLGLADIALAQGELQAGGTEVRALVAAWRRIDENHPDALVARRLLVQVLIAEGDLAAAADEQRAIIATRGAHADAAADRHQLADVLTAAGRYGEAESELREAALAKAGLLGDDHPEPLVLQGKAAACLLLQGHVTAARTELDALLPRIEAKLGTTSELVLMSRLNLAQAHQLSGNPAAARLELHHVLRLCESNADELKEIVSTASAMLRMLA